MTSSKPVSGEINSRAYRYDDDDNDDDDDGDDSRGNGDDVDGGGGGNDGCGDDASFGWGNAIKFPQTREKCYVAK